MKSPDTLIIKMLLQYRNPQIMNAKNSCNSTFAVVCSTMTISAFAIRIFAFCAGSFPGATARIAGALFARTLVRNAFRFFACFLRVFAVRALRTSASTFARVCNVRHDFQQLYVRQTVRVETPNDWRRISEILFVDHKSRIFT